MAALAPHEHKRSFSERFARDFKEHYLAYLMLVAPIALTILFSYVPMYGILIAFKN